MAKTSNLIKNKEVSTYVTTPKEESNDNIKLEILTEINKDCSSNILDSSLNIY